MTIDDEEKMLHIQLWEESGMSKRAYAKENGINRNTFYGWCSKGASKGCKEESRLVELEFGKKARNFIDQRGGDIVLHTLNGYRLEITESFEKACLRDLLDVLEAR